MMDLLKQSEQLNQRSGEPKAHAQIRSLAAKQFTALSWPTKKLEAWRYSPTQKLQGEYQPQINLSDIDTATPSTLSPQTAARLPSQEEIQLFLATIISPHFESIIFYNGQPLEVNLTTGAKTLQKDSSLSTAVTPSLIKSQTTQPSSLVSNNSNATPFEIKSLKQAFSEGLLDEVSLQSDNNKLEALNLSYLDQGYVVHIHENAVIDKPLHIIHLYSSLEEKPLFQSRLHIIAAKKSHATLLEAHFILKNTTSLNITPWTNSTTVVNVNDEAQLIFIQWNETPSTQQDTHRTHITVKNKSYLHFLQGSFCAGWRRNEFTLNLQGADAEIKVHSLGLSKNAGIADQPSVIDFSGLNNQCQQIVKNLLLDQSRAIFNGHIKIQPTAQKTNSSQLHQSLLLSTEAEVDTKPELEIYADDVQATHGATVGQLNADELFYFQSRGISKETAYSLICLGFLTDLCDHLPNQDLQNYLKSRIRDVWMKEDL